VIVGVGVVIVGVGVVNVGVGVCVVSTTVDCVRGDGPPEKFNQFTTRT